MYPVVPLGDIQKAFLQIEIDPGDIDTLRFLWYENPKDPNPVVKEYRFTRNIFGSGPSPYVLGGTMKHHLANYQEENPSLVNTLKKECMWMITLVVAMTHKKYLESINK